MNYTTFTKAYLFKKKLDPKKDRYLQKTSDDEHTSLFDVCQTLQMSMNGSSDPLIEEVEEKYIAWLMMRLETWKYSSSSYDEAIRNVVLTTVNDCRQSSRAS